MAVNLDQECFTQSQLSLMKVAELHTTFDGCGPPERVMIFSFIFGIGSFYIKVNDPQCAKLRALTKRAAP